MLGRQHPFKEKTNKEKRTSSEREILIKKKDILQYICTKTGNKLNPRISAVDLKEHEN